MDMTKWMAAYEAAMLVAFGDRVRYIGLQGSRGRGEAWPDSDIDVVLILDELTPADLETYRAAAAALPERDKLCGFVSGAAELAAWDRGELFQFRRDTTDYYGCLSDLLPPEEPGDARRALHTAACGIYHLCCHNGLHGRDLAAAEGTCKGAVFALQAKAYLETGTFYRRHRDLGKALTGADLAVFRAAEAVRQGEHPLDLDALTALLLEWSGDLIRRRED